MEEVSTARGLQQSVTITTVTGRATICDLMCVTTTSTEFFEASVPRKKFSKSLNVSLPYKKQTNLEEISHTNVTPFQAMKNMETVQHRNKLLKLEREEFMRKTAYDRMIKHKRERLGATMMQALFRGYCTRPKIPGNRRRPKGPEILSMEALRSLLCDLTSQLNLSHIQGLTLKIKTKNSRQRSRIDNAAAFRIQKFFKMLVARRKARIYMNKKKRRKHFAALSVLRRILRHFGGQIRKRKEHEAFKNACCIKIQSTIRIFLARRRVRLMRALKTRSSRENEAATIIQRSFRRILAQFYYPDFEGFLATLEDAIFEAEIADCAYITAEIMMIDEIERAAIEERLLVEENARKAAVLAKQMEQKRLDEIARLREVNLQLARKLAREEEKRRIAKELEDQSAELALMAKEDIRELWHVSEGLRVLEEARLEEEVRVRATQEALDAVERHKQEQEEAVAAQSEEEQEREREREEYERRKGEASIEAERLEREAVEAIESERRTSVETERQKALEVEAERFAETNRRASEQLLFNAERDATAAHRGSLRYVSEKVVGECVEEALRNQVRKAVSEDIALRNPEVHDLARIVVEDWCNAAMRKIGDKRWDLMTDEEKEQRLIELAAAKEERDRSAAVEAEAEAQRVADLEEERLRGEEEEAVAEIERKRLASLLPLEMMTEGDELNKKGLYGEAESVLSVLLQRLLGLSPVDRDSALLAAVQLLLGHTKLSVAKYTEAKDLFSSCEGIRILSYTEESVPVAEAKEGLAKCARQRAEYAESKILYAEALRITTMTLKAFQSSAVGGDITANTQILHVKVLLGFAELSIDCGDYQAASERIEKVASLVSTGFGSGSVSHTDCQYVQAVLLRLKGLYKESSILMRSVSVQYREDYGSFHPKVVTSLGHLSETEMLLCNFKEASDILESALAMGSKFFTNIHPISLNLSYIKSRILCCMGQYKVAEDLAAECLRKSKTLFLSHPLIADGFSIIGDVTRLSGNPRGGQKFYEECSEIRRKLFLPEASTVEGEESVISDFSHISVGESAAALGINAIARGMFLEAFPLLEYSVKLFSDILPKMNITSHIQLENSKVMLAHICHLTGRYTRAETLFKSAEEGISLLIGDDHLYTADCLYHKALYRQTIGDFSVAKELLSRNGAILSSLFGARHPYIARNVLAESVAHRYPGNFEVSAGLLHTALSLTTEAHGEESLSVAMVVYMRAQLMRDLGDLNEASRLYPTALKIFRDVLGSKNAYVALIMGDIGETFRLEGRGKEAESALKQALTLRGKCYTEKHYAYAETMISQSLLLIDGRQPQEGLLLLQDKVLPLLESCFGQMHPMIMYAQGCIGKAKNALAVIKNREKEDHRSSTDNPKSPKTSSRKHSKADEAVVDEEGQNMIEKALSYFAEYPLSPFGDSHPWVLELGGWGDDREEEKGRGRGSHHNSRNSSAKSKRNAER